MSAAPAPNFEEARKRHIKFSGVNRGIRPTRGRRSITNKHWKNEDTRTEFEKMEDKAIVSQGMAIQKTGWESEDEVKRHVVAAYGNGNSKLTAPQIAAVTAIAWSMQLDPSPGLGHIYAWEQDKRLVLAIGYQGYLYKAQQQHQIFYNPTRPMTQVERELHGLQDGQIGAVCELYEMNRARMAKEIGVPITPIVGIAVWKPGDNVAKTRTGFWMASKNAIKDAIRQLGIGFNAMPIPEIDGFYYDHTSDQFYEVEPSGADIEVPYDSEVSDEVIEGEITEKLAEDQEKAETKEPAEALEESEKDARIPILVNLDGLKQYLRTKFDESEADADKIARKNQRTAFIINCNERDINDNGQKALIKSVWDIDTRTALTERHIKVVGAWMNEYGNPDDDDPEAERKKERFAAMVKLLNNYDLEKAFEGQEAAGQ